MTNDQGVLLDDVRPENLNETSAIRSVKVASDLFHPTEPIPEYLQPRAIEAPELGMVVWEAPTVPLDATATRYDEIRPPSDTGAQAVRTWYLVRVLSNGREVDRSPIPEEIASDPVKLFQSLREMGLPNGRYRIYLEEMGFPRRMVYEFYKSGNSFGDPVRERGPGSNPVQEGQPVPVPAGKQGVSTWHVREDAVAVAGRPGGSAGEAPESDRPAVSRNEAGQSALEHPTGAALMTALADWRIQMTRRGWAHRVDEAMEKCPEGALSRGARLRRRMKGD
jgi:hypothetical protein